jgi:hypothetical protein
MEVNRNEYYKRISEIISKDIANKSCFDCGKAFPKFVSINNGIFICNTCADEHRVLGVGISFIRSITDPWDEYLLLYIERGGNMRLKRVFTAYKVDEGQSIADKYKTKASEYCRLLVMINVNPTAQI